MDLHFHTEVGVESMNAESVKLTNGEELKSDFTMLMPPFIGVDLIFNSPKLNSTKAGYIPVGADYRHRDYDNIWAAGIAVDVELPFTPKTVPFGAPKTGYPSDETGKIVAENIIRISKGETKLKEKEWGKIPGLCVMDAGKKEVIIISDHLFKPRKFGIMIPNVFYDVFKILFEKYFLWKMKKGYSFLP